MSVWGPDALEHDGLGKLRFDQRPFVVVNDEAFVDLGVVTSDLSDPEPVD